MYSIFVFLSTYNQKSTEQLAFSVNFVKYITYAVFLDKVFYIC